MRRRVRQVLLSCATAIFALVAWLVWFTIAPISLSGASADFTILAGSSLRSATRQIIEAGVPVSEWRFNLIARVFGKETQVKAGSYEIKQGATPWALLRKITQGDFQLTEIVFIEGWTFAQMRAALDAHAGVRHDTAGLSEADVMTRLGAPGAAEGMFFPDTYLFARGESDLVILARAHRLMQKQLHSAWEQRVPDLPLSTPYEALVLASIVEKETGDERERGLVAGVLANRLKLGMKLQADPSVIYGMGARFDGNLRKKDLSQDTPFNTYTRAGLPPRPISMPGRAALFASVQPARTDALYFVARGDGTHQFSRSLDEHNRAVARYQKAGARP